MSKRSENTHGRATAPKGTQQGRENPENFVLDSRDTAVLPVTIRNKQRGSKEKRLYERT